ASQAVFPEDRADHAAAPRRSDLCNPDRAGLLWSRNKMRSQQTAIPLVLSKTRECCYSSWEGRPNSFCQTALVWAGTFISALTSQETVASEFITAESTTNPTIM